MWPAGPFALCWLAPGPRQVYRNRLPCTTLEDALAWARGYAALPTGGRVFWLEAWDEAPPLAYDVSGKAYCSACGDSGSGPCEYHANHSGMWAARLKREVVG